jgi:DNA-directed RNA polymerase subunit RPC12/RpoP
MPILETMQRRLCPTLRNIQGLLWMGLTILALLLLGCKKDVAHEASDSDANGYICLGCGAKLYSERTDFLGPRCPNCKQDKLVEVVGFRCPKDEHLTMQPRSGARQEAAVCEVCKAHLGGMSLPREHDLKTWGAQKLSSKTPPS